MQKSLAAYCAAQQDNALLLQWDKENNEALTPDDVTIGSRRKIWWCCPEGHSWKAQISSRTKGKGCPVCNGRAVIPGENDMASSFPELAAQWHPTKNPQTSPDRVTPYSNRRVWWQCELGHEWQATVAHRTASNSGCPVCAGRQVQVGFNDLATVEPKLAAQWHPELNGPLTPEMVTAGSHKRVWWQCQDGHSWRAVVYSRATGRKSGCPICAGVEKKKSASSS